MIAPPRPPAHDELEALIKEARARQLRRRLLGAASVALVAALGLSAYALSIGRAAHGSRTGTPANAEPPLCHSSQLSASFTPGGSAGTSLGGMLIHNAGNSCSLPAGQPIVQVIFGGKPLATRESSWGKGEDFGKPAGRVAPPGTKTFFEIGWGDMNCPNPYAAPSGRQATLSVQFGDGLRLAVPETPTDGFVSLPGCGEAMNPPPAIFVSGLLSLRRGS